MLIFREKQPLDEMATVCSKDDGYGMILEVYSNDHGVIGNKANPAHAHLKATDGKYLGKFAITDQPPRSDMYVFDYDKSHLIPPEFKKKLVVWAKAKYNRSPVTNWWFLKNIWGTFHRGKA